MILALAGGVWWRQTCEWPGESTVAGEPAIAVNTGDGFTHLGLCISPHRLVVTAVWGCGAGTGADSTPIPQSVVLCGQTLAR